MLKKITFRFALLAALLLGTVSVYGQSANLIEAGKKEGKVVVYGSLESDSAETVFNVFKKKTGIDVDYWRASATKVMDRALSEYRAGKPLFDAVTTITDAMEIVLKEGIFAKYESPSAKGFQKEAIHPQLGPRYREVIIGTLYNSSMIKVADAPKSLEDLVTPKYRGKLGMPDPTQHTTTTQW